MIENQSQCNMLTLVVKIKVHNILNMDSHYLVYTNISIYLSIYLSIYSRMAHD